MSQYIDTPLLSLIFLLVFHCWLSRDTLRDIDFPTNDFPILHMRVTDTLNRSAS